MFDTLLGRKFSARCKHSIKLIKERIFLIRKKKLAMLNFLKKDIADLIADGHDAVAFGRIEGLIAEINHISCYDMIEKFCECILKQLPTLQKQRECPQEDMEAVSTLIFAAARFSDLPELCDLRRIFTMRYGSSMESSVNPEFIEKKILKSFSMDRKLQLMRDIVQEFSIKWDSEAFRYKMSNPSESASGRPKKVESLSKGKEDGPFHEPLSRRKEKAINVDRQEISSYGRCEPEPTVTAPKYVQTESKDVHVISSTNNGHRLEPFVKTKKVLADEPETVETYCTDATISYVKAKGSRNGTQRDDQQDTGFSYSRSARAQEGLDPIGQEKRAVGQLKNNDDKPVNLVPPYTKPNSKNNGNHPEDIKENGSYNKLLVDRQGSDPIGQERRAVGQVKSEYDRAINMVPPYVKPKANDNAKSSDPTVHEHGHVAHDGSNVDGEKKVPNDGVVGDGRPKPRSVRRKHAKPPKVYENDGNENGSTVDGEVPEDQVLSDRRRHDRRQSTPTFEAGYDEEEKVMDRLLIHYSKKGIADPSGKSRARTKAPPTEHVVDAGKIGDHQTNGRPHLHMAESVHAPERAVSLPPEPVSPIDTVVKGPVRAASMQPDLLSPKGARVHPRLPNYDELAARFIALKKG